MTVLVTGGCGFIGSHMVEDLKNCVIIDNLATSSPESHDSAIHSVSQDRIKVFDIADYSQTCDVLSTIDKVYHLAAVPRVPLSVKDPMTSIYNNVYGTTVLFQACRDMGIKDIVFASSSSVYGGCTSPMEETLKPTPISPYATSKAACEMLAQNFNSLYDMNISCLRYFNVYGPRQDYDSEYSCVIPKFIKAGLAHTKMEIYGDGSQTRDFTYVKDVVKANKKAMGTSGVYNICTGSSTTINNLAHTIADELGIKPKIHYLDKRDGDILTVTASSHKAKQELKWEAEYTLDEGIAETVPHYYQDD